MHDETQFDHLIGLIYDAATAPERWSAALEAVGDALGGCAFVMSILAPREGLMFAATARVDPDYRALLERRYARPQTNPLLAAMLGLPQATPVVRPAIQADRDYFAGELYNEVFRPQGLAHVAVACVLRSPECTVPLGVLRQVKAGRPDERDLHLLGRLLPHMQRSVQVSRRLVSIEGLRGAAEEALDHVPFGVILVNADGRVVNLNRSAEAIVAAADGLTLSDGALAAATSVETGALLKIIQEAAATGRGAGTHPGGAMALSRPSTMRPLTVLIAPLRSQQTLPVARRAAAVVFVSDPDRCAAACARRLVELFGLTPAEAQLAVALLAGKRLGRIAADRGVRLPTVRNQLRAVLAKTGTGRQAELVGLLASVPALSRVT